jgi:hypothetical protein
MWEIFDVSKNVLPSKHLEPLAEIHSLTFQKTGIISDTTVRPNNFSISYELVLTLFFLYLMNSKVHIVICHSKRPLLNKYNCCAYCHFCLSCLPIQIFLPKLQAKDGCFSLHWVRLDIYFLILVSSFQDIFCQTWHTLKCGQAFKWSVKHLKWIEINGSGTW